MVCQKSAGQCLGLATTSCQDIRLRDEGNPVISIMMDTFEKSHEMGRLELRNQE